MDATLLTAVFALGLGGGFLSGLLGIGGGVLIFPLLLLVPPALGLAPLGVKAAAAITSVQSFFGAVSGAFGHHRHRKISYSLALWFGAPMAAASLAGSIGSHYAPPDWILITFSLMAAAAAVLILLPAPQEPDDGSAPQTLQFDRALAAGCGLILGGLSGLVGQGGAFLFIPVMLYMLRIPLRITIGTALVIGIASSTAVLLGRLGTAQIPWTPATIAVIGAIIGGQLGSRLSQRVPRKLLRRALSVIIVGTAVHMATRALGT